MEAIKLDEVYAVYSGKAGACCCGCKGKYSYASQHRDMASLNRGYAVTDVEVNDVSVARMVAKMNKNLDNVENYGNGVYGFTTETRQYTVHTTKVKF